ncbi:hypothetical protein TSUD_169610 [Trifolium subterraneum]|nr:hypothetical protein TSUD_169610 [Trifolium subterraneum]
MSWREVLPEAPDLSGFVALNSRNESEEVKDIVENVTCLLDMTDLFVGVKSRIQDMIQWLNIQQSNDIILQGFWGMGGIGKTTIAMEAPWQISVVDFFRHDQFCEGLRCHTQIWQRICRPVLQIVCSLPFAIDNTDFAISH